MAKVTIEGSITPSVLLARGERRTVAHTEKIDRLIAKGYVIVVDDESGEQTPAAEHSAADTQKPAAAVPARNSSRDDWAWFLSNITPPIIFDADAKRDELIGLWDADERSSETDGDA